MPWTPSDAKKKNKKLTDEQAVVWAKVANGDLVSCLEEGGEQGTCEGRAIRVANAAANRAYSKKRSRMHISDFDEKNIQEVAEGSLDALHDHAHTMAEAGKGDAELIERLHELCIKEYSRREKEMWHQTILQFRFPRGLYMTAPHGELIYQGKKGSLARAKKADLSGKWVIVSGSKAYGDAMIGTPEEVGTHEFDTRFEEHRVTVRERNKWWPRAKALWLYPIDCFIPYAAPAEVDVLSGVRMVMDTGVQFREKRKSQYDRSRCMLCEKEPQVDILWADGRGRAWFCAEHGKAWLKKEFEGQEVTRVWQIDGEVPEGIGNDSKPLWSKGTTKTELLARIEKRFAEKGGAGSGWFAPPKGTHGTGVQGVVERERAEGITATTHMLGDGPLDEATHTPGWENSRRVIKHMAFNDYRDGTGNLLLVRDQEEIVGVVSTGRRTWDAPFGGKTPGKYREIYCFATKRRGYGRATMDEALRQAETNREGVFLKSVPRAVGFYEKIGMKSTEDLFGKRVFYWTPKDVADAVKEDLADLEPEDGAFVDPRSRARFRASVLVTNQTDSKTRRLAFAEKAGAEILEERPVGPVTISVGDRGFSGNATVTTFKTQSTGHAWYRYEVDYDPPVPIEGKGENSWDLEDDHIYSISVPLDSDDEAGYEKAIARIVEGFPADRLLDQKGSDGSGNWGHTGYPGVGGSSSGGGLARIGASPEESGVTRRARAQRYREHRAIAPKLADSAKQEVIFSIREVLDHGESTGNEALIALFLQGNKANGTQYGSKDQVDMNSFIDKNGDTLPILIHNHPSGASFSRGDVQFLFNTNVTHLIVVGHNGTLYRMSRTDKTPDLKWVAGHGRDAFTFSPAQLASRPSHMTEDELYAGLLAIDTWGNIFNKDFKMYSDRVSLVRTMTESEAAYEHLHKVNLEFADTFSLHYERIEPS